MSEPPFGINHGRTRTASGWRDLETNQGFPRSPAVRDDLTSPTVHGTLTSYFSRGCRCGLCRRVASEYQRIIRQRRRGV